jgi:hypothetical protein
MNKKHKRPEYEILAGKIKSGELTRQQAATASQFVTGLAPGTFMSWLRSSGAIKDLKETRLTAGQNSRFASKNPTKVKAYEQAVAAVLAGRRPKATAEEYGVSYPYLLQKVSKVKPPKAPPTTPEEDLVQEIMVASRFS